MPTTKPRYQVTETPDIERALDLAARRWPDESRSRLLIRLIGVGGDALADQAAAADVARREAIERAGWSYADLYVGDYLADLRQDWRE